SASELGMEMPGCLRGRYAEDAFFKRIVEAPDQFHHFKYVDGLLYQEHNESYQLCIPDVLIGTRKAREVLLKHAHSILAHLGARKTLDYLRGEVWW
ncbi:hypothetical protein L226DRAFT_426701, partial [Lentinus tigrinus ALCF2SS1-7]